MAVIKCKMCGGDLNIVEGQSVCECEYCGTRQTVPMLDDEKKMNLFARANRLRFNSEFDKASGIYESIIADAPEEAEAYWGLVLCRYGIEYVDDPATDRKVPTCHRSSFDSVMQDSDFELACEYADPTARKVYREEAKQIEEIRKGILEVSGREEPYDIFICYKETDAEGNRTLDSVLAQDLYDVLTDKGYRVFFARITLEDKLGQVYEPYIFAALNSAKIMLAVGTDYDYYNAVWVKNEWSRYLKLMVKDKEKHLIPCYKNLDAYDMPEEFAKLQAQDLGKVGAIQDLLRGIEKLLPRKKQEVRETVVVQRNGTAEVAPLLKRGFMFLEDGNWASANEYCERVLDMDPECAEAYLGKLMSQLQVRKRENLKYQAEPFDRENNYEKTVRFADQKLRKELTDTIGFIKDRNESTRKNTVYENAKAKMTGEKIAFYEEAINELNTIPGWKDADQLIIACQNKAKEIRKKEEQQRFERERQEKFRRQEGKKRKKRISIIMTAVICACIAFMIIIQMVIIPSQKLKKANSLIESGDFTSAYKLLDGLDFHNNQENPQEITIKYYKALWADPQIGDIITFGIYGQDSNPDSAKRDIQWQVLDKKDGKILVISKYALDYRPYNTQDKDSTWEKCSLRMWLKTQFINDAFTEEQQKMIPTMTVSADDNPEYNTNPGNDTQDKIFLLSIEEMNQYFSSDDAMVCNPTFYAAANNIDLRNADLTGNKGCYWWLRSPGGDQDFAAFVFPFGGIATYGRSVDNDGYAVRPAMWIDLEF